MKHAFLFVTAFVCLTAASALACSCKAPPPPKTALEQSAAVFVGKVIKMERGNRFGVTVTMEVTTVWKGVTEKTVTIDTGLGGGDCGYGFKVGQSYLVYAYRSTSADGEPGPLATNICTRTRELDKARGDIQALGPAKMPPV